MSQTATVETAEQNLPAWAEQLRRRYLSGESSIFLLHGAVDDLVPWGESYVPLREFLQKFLLQTRDYLLFFNHSEGLRLEGAPESRAVLYEKIRLNRARAGRPERTINLPTETGPALALIEEALLVPDAHGAVIIEYAETVVPETRLSFMSSEDRANLVRLQQWTVEPRVLRSDNLVILIAENMAEIHQKVVSSPQLCIIEIAFPDLAERERFLGHLARRYRRPEPTPGVLAPMTAGLSRLHLENIYREAFQSGVPVGFDLIRKRKKEIIENECFGLVEIVDTRHDFSHVGGMEHVKGVLSRVAEAIRQGNSRRVPMGAMFVGPMGTGKSFLAEAFAKESGLTCIKLKNIRGSLVGETEANLERVLKVVKAMGYVLVIIDEGDRAIGGGGERANTDGGVDSRLIARLKEFMSDTTHRGQIVFLMMTNRPDKLDADMKRPGRFDLKIPFFSPESDEERDRIFRALLKKNSITHTLEDFSGVLTATRGYTGAEIEAVLLLALGFAEERGSPAITQDDLVAAVRDFIPSRDSAMVELMELLAVFECSSRRMLPSRFQELSSEEINSRLREVKTRLLMM